MWMARAGHTNMWFSLQKYDIYIYIWVIWYMIYVWSVHDFLNMEMFTQYGFVYEERWCQSPQNWRQLSMGISGSDLLEVPTIYKAYSSGLCKRISWNSHWNCNKAFLISMDLRSISGISRRLWDVRIFVRVPRSISIPIKSPFSLKFWTRVHHWMVGRISC